MNCLYEMNGGGQLARAAGEHHELGSQQHPYSATGLSAPAAAHQNSGGGNNQNGTTAATTKQVEQAGHLMSAPSNMSAGSISRSSSSSDNSIKQHTSELMMAVSDRERDGSARGR